MTPRKTVIVQLHVRVAWWLPCYLRIVGALCELLDRAPNMERVESVVKHGVRIVAVPVDRVAA